MYVGVEICGVSPRFLSYVSKVESGINTGDCKPYTICILIRCTKCRAVHIIDWSNWRLSSNQGKYFIVGASNCCGYCLHMETSTAMSVVEGLILASTFTAATTMLPSVGLYSSASRVAGSFIFIMCVKMDRARNLLCCFGILYYSTVPGFLRQK